MAPTWPSASRSLRAARASGRHRDTPHASRALTQGRDFVNEIQSHLQQRAQGTAHDLRREDVADHVADDGLSDDIGDSMGPIMLPNPDLGNLHEIENHMRAANSTTNGREALAKFVLAQDYIPKLIPLVEMAEDLESVSDLHRLCSIMKMLILLNDTAIIEYVVTDEVVLGVVGALECTVRTPALSDKAKRRR